MATSEENLILRRFYGPATFKHRSITPGASCRKTPPCSTVPVVPDSAGTITGTEEQVLAKAAQPGPFLPRQARAWLDRVIKKRDAGKLIFADAFTGGSEEEKAYFAKLEGGPYAPEPRNILFSSCPGVVSGCL